MVCPSIANVACVTDTNGWIEGETYLHSVRRYHFLVALSKKITVLYVESCYISKRCRGILLRIIFPPQRDGSPAFRRKVQILAKIDFTLDRSEELALAKRCAEMLPSKSRSLDEVTELVQFLRGVHSEVTILLPAFYLHFATKAASDGHCVIKGSPGFVLHYVLTHTSIATITLSCRKAFDSAKKGLTGRSIAKAKDVILDEAAKYYARDDRLSKDEAFAALTLLRTVFQECTGQINVLLRSKFSLCKRIGLLIQHANGSSAHISLENFKFSIADCAHVVGALTLIAEIIRQLDGGADAGYFETLDEASCLAAAQLFPSISIPRLFGDLIISDQAKNCWKSGGESGHTFLLHELPYATSWF